MANNNNRKKNKKSKGFIVDNKIKFLVAILAVFLIIGLTAAGAAYAVIKAYIEDAPEMDFDQLIPSQTTNFYDMHEKHWTDVYADENRIHVPLSAIPQHVQDAFIAIEDERFYEHPGIDLKAIGRAFVSNLRRQRISQGGSTITQQLVKNAFLTPDRDYKRKIQEAYLAYQLERSFHKDEILEFYLNWIYFDYSTNGVEAASQMFFQKSVGELTLAQAAMLAGVPNNPSLFSPYRNPDGARNRQLIILGKMLELEMINQEEYQEAKEEELIWYDPPTRTAPYFSFYQYVVFSELERILPTIPELDGIPWATAMYRSGLHIYTTLDPELQAYAEAVVNDPKNYPNLVEDDKGILQPQANVVLAEPETGYLRVLVGGRDSGKTNHVLRFNVGRDTGSAMKPFMTYAAALEEGVITTATPIDDSPVVFLGGTYHPENFARRFYGIVNMREAQVHSHNISALRVFTEMGVSKGVEYAQQFGLESLINPPGITTPKGDRKHDHNISTALGGLTRGVSTLEMVQSYAVLANGGIRIDLTAITRIEDSTGKVIYEYKPEPKRIVSEETAFIINDILRDVVSRGTASYLKLDRQVAAKTGTSQNRRTAYLMAYTRDYVMGYWMGHDIPADGEIKSPWTYAPKFFNPILKKAHEGLPARSFKRPSTIVTAAVCVKSGMRPGPHCPTEDTVTEIFKRGTVPTEICDVHAPMIVCSESGLLPTEFCPDHLLEERIFFDRPEYLTTTSKWAGGRGRTPPDIDNMPPTETCDIHTERSKPPENLSYNLSNGSVVVQWSAPGGIAIEGYLVFRKLQGADTFVRLTPDPIKNRSYTDETVQEEQTYVYQVVAVSKQGTFSQGSSITVVVPKKVEQYTLTVLASPSEGGTVTGGGTYEAGSRVDVEAAAKSGWNFVEWQGPIDRHANREKASVVMDEPKTVTAIFEKVPVPQVTLTIEKSGDDGKCTVNPNPGTHTYDRNTEVKLTATVVEGYEFEKWSINGSDDSKAEITIKLDKNTTARAHFKAVDDNGSDSAFNWWGIFNRFLAML